MTLIHDICREPVMLKDMAYLKVVVTSLCDSFTKNYEIQKKFDIPQKKMSKKLARRIRLGRLVFLNCYWEVIGQEPLYVLSIYMDQLLNEYQTEVSVRDRKKRILFYVREIRHFLPYIASDKMVLSAQYYFMKLDSLSLMKSIIRKMESYIMLNNLLILASFYSRHFLIEFLVRQGADDFYTAMKAAVLRQDGDLFQVLRSNHIRYAKHGKRSKYSGSEEYAVYAKQIRKEMECSSYQVFLSKKRLRAILDEYYPLEDDLDMWVNGIHRIMSRWYPGNLLRCILCLKLEHIKHEMVSFRNV